MTASSPLSARSNDDPERAVLLVLAGPAGSGKTTLCERIVSEIPSFSRVITATTRSPRPGEIDGVHYHFLTPEKFDAHIEAGHFLEWAWVHKTNRYGTLTSSILEPLQKGRNLIINVDVQGVDNLRRAGEAHPLLARHMATIFINVNLSELRQRMQERGHDEDAEILKRLQTAERELQEGHRFDFRIESRSREEDFQELINVWKSVQARLRNGVRSL